MKIFITGGNGFIGGEFLKKFSNKYKIKNFDLKNGQDILNYEDLKKSMNGYDVVIHFAAIAYPKETENFTNYFNVNCVGTLNIANACLENNIKKLIYISSTSYYGLENGIPYDKPIKESNRIISQYINIDDLKCRDCDIAYSTSKVIAEQILLNYGMRKKFQTIILRLGPVGESRDKKWSLDGFKVNIDNVLNVIDLSINNKNELWYEAFSILDNDCDADILKAKNLLGYAPL